MNITKQRILEIIKEEVEAAKKDGSNTKQQLRKDFLAVAKQFIPDADMVSAEVELTSALMNKILKKAGEAGTSATQLKRLNDIAGKLLAEQKKSLIVERNKKLADVLPEISSYFKSLEPNDIAALQNLLNSIKIQEVSEIEGKLIGAMLDLTNDFVGQVKTAEEVIPEIKKLIKQLIDSQSLTPTKIIVKAISSAIGEQIGNRIVDPLVEKIELAVTGGQTAAAGATVATGGGASVPSALFAAALQGLKIFAKKFAKDKAKSLITNLISETINNILSGFEEIENADEVLAKILGAETMQLVDAALKQDKNSKDKINTIKDIIKSNYDDILKNIFIVAAQGDLGDTAKRYTLELINAKILGIPLGPFIGEMILGGDITEKLTSSETKQELQQLADKGKEAADTAEPSDPESDEAPPTDPDEESPTETDEEDVVELSPEDKVILSQFDELVDAFTEFSDEDNGFMHVPYLVDQDELLLKLRRALKRFIGEEEKPKAINEQEEKSKPEEQKAEDPTQGERKKLVKHVSRYRRDINKTVDVLKDYFQQAKAGTYKAQVVLNRLKGMVQNLQNDNSIIIRDLKSLAGIQESLLTEETREDKIKKVRSAYEEIVNSLKFLLDLGKKAPDLEASEEQPEQQDEVLVLEDIYIESLNPNDPELQSYVNDVRAALSAIETIKSYFKLTGSFNRPLEDIETDFREYVAKYKDTMGDLVSDLKEGLPTAEDANKYANSFAELAKKIEEDFGISPEDPIVTKQLTVGTKTGDETEAAVNDSEEATQAAEQDPKFEEPKEFEIEDTTLEELEEIRKEQVEFFKSIFTINKELKSDDINLEKIANQFDKIKNTRISLEENEEYSKLYHGLSKYKNLIVEMIKDINLADILENDQALKFFIELIDNYIKIYGQIGIVVKKAKEEENVEPLDVIDNLKTAAIQKQFTTAAKHLEKANKEFTKGELIRAGFKETIIDKLLSFAFDILSNKELDVQASPVGADSDLDESKQNKNLLERMIKEELKVLNGKKMVRN
jgi:hypothetical protein